MTKPTLLVVGARDGSLGMAVALEAEDQGFDVVTAGVSGEKIYYDISGGSSSHADVILEAHQNFLVIPDAIVCTAGINEPSSVRGELGLLRNLWTLSMTVNALGPVSLLAAYFGSLEWQDYSAHPSLHGVRHFVAVSSNSASIARSKSLAYCASKAALTMGIRVAARELAHEKEQISSYVYEPGWIEGTPMSEEVRRTFTGPPHRIPHQEGIGRWHLAAMIVNNLRSGMSLNGCALRVDGGEQ